MNLEIFEDVENLNVFHEQTMRWGEFWTSTYHSGVAKGIQKHLNLPQDCKFVRK